MVGCGRRRAAPRARRARRPAGDTRTSTPRAQSLLCAFPLRYRQNCQTSEGGRAGRRSISIRSSWVPETVADILAAHRAGRTTPEETLARSYARIASHADPAIFITLREQAQARAEARALTETGRRELPLYGIPVAVKDNIDVAGM